MKAHGLGDMTYAKAFMEKVLEEGVDAISFANSLSDKRYAEFAKTFNFKAFGEATTSFTKTQQGVVDKYLRQTLEEQAGDENQGVRLALYFQRKAETIDELLRGSGGSGPVPGRAHNARPARFVRHRHRQAGRDVLRPPRSGNAGRSGQAGQTAGPLPRSGTRPTAPESSGGDRIIVSCSAALRQYGISEDLMLQIAQLKR
jgi:hypothetical protein